VKFEKAAFIGLEEAPEELAQMQLYPNPSEGRVELLTDFTAGTLVRWSLRTINGQQIQQDQFLTDGLEVQFLDFSELPAGVYVFELHAAQEHFTQRLILK